MKKIGLLFLFLILYGASMHAQMDKDQISEKLEARKVAYLSSKLDLSPEEAQSFWPVYNSYNDEMKSVREERNLRKEFMESGNIDADKILDQLIQREEKELAIRKKYVSELKQTIGSAKTLHFFRLERQFKEEILHELKNRRSGHRGR